MAINPVVPKKEDERSKSGRHKPFNFHDYAVSILIALVLTVFYGGYYIIQRAYMFHAPPGIDAFYVPDKVIAVVALYLSPSPFLSVRSIATSMPSTICSSIGRRSALSVEFSRSFIRSWRISFFR